ncbi:unnamed protein product [Ambrosiozyma monospora]|uniref:Unnamed protein product n=1 Tax=Ambrosiozyma monospora TaxID=43982 RepID=A0A9W7DIQ2_AMBMO|nr:unnamed protein product [Ambrosiozyma monospora]
MKITFPDPSREFQSLSIAGSFNNWSPSSTQLIYIKDQGQWELPQKEYETFPIDEKIPFKFIINGDQWICSSLYPIELDPQGNANNVITMKPDLPAGSAFVHTSAGSPSPVKVKTELPESSTASSPTPKVPEIKAESKEPVKDSPAKKQVPAENKAKDESKPTVKETTDHGDKDKKDTAAINASVEPTKKETSTTGPIKKDEDLKKDDVKKSAEKKVDEKPGADKKKEESKPVWKRRSM